MKRLLPLVLFCLSFSSWLEAAGSTWTEHRRALLINASKDKAHEQTVKALAKALRDKGFVVTSLGNGSKGGGVTYEKWVRSIPTMGVSLFYYLGDLETEKSRDGKRVCHSMQLGGYKVLPPARDPEAGRSRVEGEEQLGADRAVARVGLGPVHQGRLHDARGHGGVAALGANGVEFSHQFLS